MIYIEKSEFDPFCKKVFDFEKDDLRVASSDFTLFFFKPTLLDLNCSEKFNLRSENAISGV